MYEQLAIQVLPKPFIDKIDRYLDQHGRTTAKGTKVVGKRTMRSRRYVILRGFAILQQEGFRLHDPDSFREKHLEVMAKYWEREGLSASYIQNNISIFRQLSRWMGKLGMITRSERYVENPASVKRTFIAERNKAWLPNGVDPDDVITIAENHDPLLGIYLRLMRDFGLRLAESIAFKPIKDITNNGTKINVRDFTKGGRPRAVDVHTDRQRDTLRRAIELADGTNGWLTPRGESFKRTMNKVQYRLRKIGVTKAGLGVTSHGLRHAYAQAEYLAKSGKLSPIAGGRPEDTNRLEHQRTTLHVMEELGHSRVDIGGAYYGSFGHRMREFPGIAELKENLEKELI